MNYNKKPSIIKYILLFCGILLSIVCYSQDDYLKSANEYYKDKKYDLALAYLNKIKKLENSAPLRLKRARCLYELNYLDQSQSELSNLEMLGYEEEELFFLKAQIFHHRGLFKQAAQTYKKLLVQIDETDRRYYAIIHLIKQCGAALDILYQEPLATVENAGKEVNTIKNESRLVQSLNNLGKFYFTSDRINKNKVSNYTRSVSTVTHPYFHEIYYFLLNNFEITSAKKIEDKRLNTYKNEELIDLSSDGNSLYIFRGKLDSDLEYHGSNPLLKNRIKHLKPIINNSRDLFFFNDSTVIFSAIRPEGFGGYDIYITTWEGQQWKSPINLGNKINSHHDEVTPYLSNDGLELYYSSNRSYSIGGFDIFRSSYLFEQAKWTNAQNLGLPINSPGDDLNYKINYQGSQASYNSDRKDGYGMHDIFLVYLNNKNQHQKYKVSQLPFLQYDHSTRNAQKDIVDLEMYKGENKENIKNGFIESIDVPTLQLSRDGELFTKENLEKLKIFIENVNKMNDPTIEILSFFHHNGNTEYELHQSILNAEKIQSMFTDNQRNNIQTRIKGFGAFLPIIEMTSQNKDEKYRNNRIEFRIHNKKNTLVNYEDHLIGNNQKNRSYQLYKTVVEKSVTYKIQIATVRKMYKGAKLELFHEVQVEKDINTGNHLYTVGLYANIMDAISEKGKLDQKGLTALSIVPYIDGIRIDENHLVDYIDEYPELKNYLRLR